MGMHRAEKQLSPPKSKNHKKMTIRCNEIAFSFVLYHEGGYVINAADFTQ